MIHPMKKYSGPLEISTGVELSISFENIRFWWKILRSDHRTAPKLVSFFDKLEFWI